VIKKIKKELLAKDNNYYVFCCSGKLV